MRTQEAFAISILDCARRLNLKFYCTRVNSEGYTEHVFYTPIRQDKNPSLYINEAKNLWYDNGGKQEGGKLLQFISYLYGNGHRDDSAALKILDGLYPELKHPSRNKPHAGGFTPRSEILQKFVPAGGYGIKEKNKSPVFEVVEVKELFSYPLKNYLTQDRKLNLDICKAYVKEVVYRHIGKNQTFYGIGFKSGDTWAVRSNGFKGFLGSGAGLSIYDRHTSSILLFEGFLDFMSYLTTKKTKNPAETCVALNSATQIKKFVRYVESNSHVTAVKYFRDRDSAGISSLIKLQESLPNIEVQDMSEAYKNHKDLNDWLVNCWLATA